MANIYDISYEQATAELLPFIKRTSRTKHYLGLFDKYIQKLHDLSLKYYLRGDDISPAHDTGSTYAYGDRARGLNNSIYEAVQDVPVSTELTNTDYWIKVLDVFIGIRERRSYKFQTVMVEYMLNRYFHTTMNYRPTLPDIYIVNNTLNNVDEQFVFNKIEAHPRFVYNAGEGEPVYFRNYSEYVPPFDFTVYVPVDVWTALSDTDDKRNAIIQAQIDKLKWRSIRNNIVTY